MQSLCINKRNFLCSYLMSVCIYKLFIKYILLAMGENPAISAAHDFPDILLSQIILILVKSVLYLRYNIPESQRFVCCVTS